MRELQGQGKASTRQGLNITYHITDLVAQSHRHRHQAAVSLEKRHQSECDHSECN